MTTDDDNDFDAMLRTAMTARPEPPDATNLAARAIAMARDERRVSTPRGAPLARTLTTLAATIAVVAMLMAGYVKLAALASLDATTSATNASSATTTDLAPTLVVGGVGLIVTLVVLVCRGMLAGDDDAIRLE